MLSTLNLWSEQALVRFKSSPKVSVVLPVLNEEEGIGDCIRKINATFEHFGIDGEIVVADNGSTDRSIAIAEALGARVVHQPLRGYGNAYMKGFSEAKGDYFVMGDADDTYDFTRIPMLIDPLVAGRADFVTGSRYTGSGGTNITFLHRFVGNPMLTTILNLFFRTSYTDVYCGFRAFTREAYEKIAPLSPGMEFNLELAINASLAGLRTREVPIQLAPRKGESKLNTLRDGWRSLRMMLLYCPNTVFMLPGLSMFFIGAILHVLAISGSCQYHGRTLGASGGTSLVATILTVVGVQVLSLGLHAKTYSWSNRFTQNTLLISFYKYFKLEVGLLAGFGSISAGLVCMSIVFQQWFASDLGPMQCPQIAGLGATLIIVGCSITFTSLYISAMSMMNVNR